MNKKVSISLLALLLFTQVSPIALSAEQILNENTTSEAVSTIENTDTEATSVDTTEQNSSEAVVTEETTTEDVATEETTTEDVATEETTTEDVATEETTTEDVATEETTAEDVATEETTAEDVATEGTVTEEVAAEETTTEDVATEETTSDDAITFELTEATTAADEVGVRSQSSAQADKYGKSRELNNSVSPEKTSINAGERELNFDVNELTLVDTADATEEKAETQTRSVETNEENLQNNVQLRAVTVKEDINTLLKNISDDQFLVDTDGEILAADETSFITIGGQDYITYAYSSLDTIGDTTNAVPLNGAAHSGKYLETVYSNGEYYAHVIIGGYEGYMYLDDIQILPGEFELPEVYYSNIGGTWTKYSPVDALTSDEYSEYQVGTAPAWAEENVKYYSTDDETFYSDTIAKSRDSKVIATGYSYFQNLPFRSTSDYTAAQYKEYLSYYVPKYTEYETSDVAYLNDTQAFVDVQKYYGVSSLFVYANANHESYYGTSTYAHSCNNFFGRQAWTNDPDAACGVNVGWTTPEDGIVAQGNFLNQNYADVNYWGYFGTHAGNKRSGVNAVYAADPDWGSKMAGHMYRMDQYFGGKEEGKYRIYALEMEAPTYTTSSLSTKLKEMGFGTNNYVSWDPTNTGNTSDYISETNVNTNYGQTLPAEPRVVVTDTSSNAFEYQLDQPIAQSTGYYPFSESTSGSYPYFECGNEYCYGLNNSPYGLVNYVVKGYSNNNVPYGTDYSKQQGWMKNSESGYATYKVINDVPAVSPGIETKPEVETKTTCTYYSNGYVKECRKYEDDVLVSIYNYYPNTVDSDKGNHIKYRFDVNKDGTIKQATKYSDVKKQRLAIYQYYSGTKYGSHTNHVKFRFDLNTDGSIKSASRYTNNAQVKDKVYTYYSGTKYSTTGSHANHMKNSFDLNSSGGVTKAQAYTNNTHYLSTIYTYYGTPKYGTHGTHIKSRYYINTSGYLYKATTSKDNNGYTQYIYTYYPYTKYGADHGNHIKNRFDNNSSEYLINAYLYADGTHNLLKKYWYDPYTRYGSHADHISKVYVY